MSAEQDTAMYDQPDMSAPAPLDLDAISPTWYQGMYGCRQDMYAAPLVDTLKAEVTRLRAELTQAEADVASLCALRDQQEREGAARLARIKDIQDDRAALTAERDGLAAVIEQVRAESESWHIYKARVFGAALPAEIRDELREILTTTPADALEAHDTAVLTDYLTYRDMPRVELTFTNQPMFDAFMEAAKAESRATERERCARIVESSVPLPPFTVRPRSYQGHVYAEHALAQRLAAVIRTTTESETKS